MRIHRIYYPIAMPINKECIIENDKAHYLRNVLRITVGRKIRLFNHQCQEVLAQITSVNKKNITIQIVKKIEPFSQSKLNISLIQSLSKGERMDYTIQKATELGVTTIQPITSEFCEVKLNDKRLDKKLKHWNNIAISACEQSFRVDIPTINKPITIADYSANSNIGLLLEPEEKLTIQQVAKNNWKELDIAIGPEGGWSQKDLELLKSSGLTGIKFGQRILRTETMAPAVMAAIHSLWGDFV